ncbi:MAG: hypothetical protein ACRCZE_01675 [Candidatus Altimarinota bacterium]
MKGLYDLLSKILGAGKTDAQLGVLARSPDEMKVVLEQIDLANKNFEERGRATKRHGRRSPRTIRGVDAPAPPELALQKEGKLVSPANPVISNAKPEPIEAPPVTMHASGVAKEMGKLNGAHPAVPDELAPTTKVDPSLLRKRMRLDTPASPVESSPDDSVPPTVDPIVPVLEVLGQQTVQKITKKQQRQKAVQEDIRKSVVAPKGISPLSL